VVTPRDAEDGSQAVKVERIKLYLLVSVYCTGFTAVEQHAEHASHIVADLDLNREVLVCPLPKRSSPNVEAALPMRASSSKTRDPDAVTFDPRKQNFSLRQWFPNFF